MRDRESDGLASFLAQCLELGVHRWYWSELADRHLADLRRDESEAIVSALEGGHEAILLERREQAVAGTLGQPEALTDLEQLNLGAPRREQAQNGQGTVHRLHMPRIPYRGMHARHLERGTILPAASRSVKRPAWKFQAGVTGRGSSVA